MSASVFLVIKEEKLVALLVYSSVRRVTTSTTQHTTAHGVVIFFLPSTAGLAPKRLKYGDSPEAVKK